jgi:hypothetical protein
MMDRRAFLGTVALLAAACDQGAAGREGVPHRLARTFGEFG